MPKPLQNVTFLRNVRRDEAAKSPELKTDQRAFLGRPQPVGRSSADVLADDGWFGLYSYSAKAQGESIAIGLGVLEPLSAPIKLRTVRGPGKYEAEPMGAYPKRVQVAPLIRCPNPLCPTNQIWGTDLRKPQLHKNGHRGDKVYYRCCVCRDSNSQRPTTFSILVLEPDEFARRYARRMRGVAIPRTPRGAPPKTD